MLYYREGKAREVTARIPGRGHSRAIRCSGSVRNLSHFPFRAGVLWFLGLAALLGGGRRLLTRGTLHRRVTWTEGQINTTTVVTN